MRHRRLVSALAVSLPATLLFSAQRAAAQRPRFEYVGKVVCGPQPDSAWLAVVRGYYATSVNVRNASTARAIVHKSVIWTFPTATEKPETPVRPDSVSTLVLAPGFGFTAECRELEGLTRTPAGAFHEGLIIIQSDQQLDVLGVYSAANLLFGKAGGQVSTMHIDRFPQRLLAQ
jgi:hypothetical protein